VKKWKIIFLFLLVTFVALQFFGPAREKNPQVKNDFLAANLPPPRIEIFPIGRRKIPNAPRKNWKT
jgi:hypothetical protein